MTRRSLLLGLLMQPDWVAADGSAFPQASWRRSADGFEAIAGLETFQDIRTVQLFRKVDFHFEWKLGPNGNSGIKYQLEKSDRWQPAGMSGWHIRARGPEFQLCDDRITVDATKQCGSLYGRLAPTKSNVVRLGEFNEGRLLIRQQSIQHWINGQLVLEYEPKSLKVSAISLQHHNTEVSFRNLRFRAAA